MDARHVYIACLLCTKLTMSQSEVEESFLEGDQVSVQRGRVGESDQRHCAAVCAPCLYAHFNKYSVTYASSVARADGRVLYIQWKTVPTVLL